MTGLREEAARDTYCHTRHAAAASPRCRRHGCAPRRLGLQDRSLPFVKGSQPRSQPVLLLGRRTHITDPQQSE